jgi:pseudaminic acid cytidylyltransferase
MNREITPCVAVIPARGGSKRLPRKNIHPFLKRPIIAYTIDAAMQCQCFDRILVSTEDEEIAGVAMSFGAEIAERPKALSRDNVGVADVCIDLLDQERRAGRRYEVMCCLYATAPLRNADDITRVLGLVGPDCDFAMAVTQYDLPPWQALKKSERDELVPMWPDWISKRSQEIPELLVDNGSTYAVKVDALMRKRSFYGPGLRGHIMPRSRSVDIDTAEDMALAEFYARPGESS